MSKYPPVSDTHLFTRGFAPFSAEVFSLYIIFPLRNDFLATGLINIKWILKLKLNNKTTIWYSKNNGYLNNARCSFNLTVPSGKLITIIPKKIFIAPNVDNIFFKTSDNTEIADFFENEYVFESHPNGYNSLVEWIFESDGSIVSEGFELEFQEQGK